MALPPLATVTDLAGWMQVDADSLPAGASAVLDRVSAIVRAEARMTFARSQTTLQRMPAEGIIRLPLRPVVSVDAVTREGSPLAYVWDAEAERLRVSGCAAVSVTFTHGYAQVPGDVAAVVLTAAARVLNNPEDLRQETVGSISRTYAAETIGASLSEADKDLLARYRRRAAVVKQI